MLIRTSVMIRVFILLMGLSQIGWVGSASVCLAQGGEQDEMARMERVAELQRQLESPRVSDREKAEKALIEMGPFALDHLEDPEDSAASDTLQRLGRIRIALEKIAVESVTRSSKVTLNGEMSVDQALKAVRQQTDNDIALSEEIPDLFAEKKIALELDQADFWTAIATICSAGELVIDPYAGGPGAVRLTPTRESRIAAANPDLPRKKAPTSEAPNDVSGIFDVTVTQVTSSRNLQNPQRNYCNVSMLVRWEPRVQPVSLDIHANSIGAIDEFDQAIQIPNPEAVLSGMVQPEIPELEFSVPIGLVDRQIEVIKTLDLTIDAVLPGRFETFRFKNIGDHNAGKELRKAGAVVTFDGIRKNDDLYGVIVRLSFDEAQNAFESHQGWAFDNPMYLETEAGEKLYPLTLDTLRQDETELGIQYLFEQDPKGMTLVYQSPAAIVRVPVKISLKNIPLP